MRYSAVVQGSAPGVPPLLNDDRATPLNVTPLTGLLAEREWTSTMSMLSSAIFDHPPVACGDADANGDGALGAADLTAVP